jgi:biopolymer transport protein ExbB
MLDLLLAGGPFMFATLAVSIITVAIFINRLLYLFVKSGGTNDLNQKLLHFVDENRIKEAVQLCGANATSPLARIVRPALQRADKSERDLRRAVEAAALEEVPRVRGATVFLPQLSNLATLLGLIGTIHGLIVAFKGAGGEGAVMRQEALSRGIAIAFYNTFFGLLVATMGIVFYLILLARTNGLLGMMERSTALTLDKLLSRRERKTA